MIASVEGVLTVAAGGFVVVDLHGLGVRAAVPASTAARLPGLGERVRLLTYLHVREDALTLFGFSTAAELELFEMLLGVSGLGPVKALALLSGSSPDSLRADIAHENIRSLARIPGIGQRTAARIVLELKDKIGPVAAESAGDGELLAWLTTMGFPAAAAQAAIAQMPKDGSVPLEERVRKALELLRPE
jgi:Holliday junction DNA helicase RuvA